MHLDSASERSHFACSVTDPELLAVLDSDPNGRATTSTPGLAGFRVAIFCEHNPLGRHGPAKNFVLCELKSGDRLANLSQRGVALT